MIRNVSLISSFDRDVKVEATPLVGTEQFALFLPVERFINILSEAKKTIGDEEFSSSVDETMKLICNAVESNISVTTAIDISRIFGWFKSFIPGVVPQLLIELSINGRDFGDEDSTNEIASIIRISARRI